MRKSIMMHRLWAGLILGSDCAPTPPNGYVQSDGKGESPASLPRGGGNKLGSLTAEEIVPFFRAHGVMLRGWALVEEGQGAEGITQLREGYAAYRALRAQIECTHWLALLAEAYRDTGRPAEALLPIAEALD